MSTELSKGVSSNASFQRCNVLCCKRVSHCRAIRLRLAFESGKNWCKTFNEHWGRYFTWLGTNILPCSKVAELLKMPTSKPHSFHEHPTQSSRKESFRPRLILLIPLSLDILSPEERYAVQLGVLNDMGFYNFDKNIQALSRK